MKKHLEDMQVKAMKLQYVLGAIRALESDATDKFREERTDLEEVAWDMARELNAGLDIVNLPEETGVAA